MRWKDAVRKCKNHDLYNSLQELCAALKRRFVESHQVTNQEFGHDDDSDLQKTVIIKQRL
jgi:hypothetical protein